MDFLKLFLLLSFFLIFSSCDDKEITKTIMVESDTYISTENNNNHSEEESLKISKSSTTENRILVKMPTENDNNDEILDEIKKDPITTLTLLPFLVTFIVLKGILDCETDALSADNLTSAKLIFDIESDAGQNLTNNIKLYRISKPWWADASWEYAHYFSSSGIWATAGGDINTSSFTPVNATDTGSTLEFDITTHFKELITTQDSNHYGFVLVPQTDIAETTLYSVQYSNSSKRPRIVTTYTGTCTNSSSFETTNTFILGSHK